MDSCKKKPEEADQKLYQKVKQSHEVMMMTMSQQNKIIKINDVEMETTDRNELKR